MEERYKVWLEGTILALIETGEMRTIPDIIGKLKISGEPVKEEELRRAVWRLVDRGQVILTKERTFRLRYM